MFQTFITRPLEAISDSPVDFLFQEIFSLAPSALVIQTLRNPHVWAKKRMHYHGRSEIVCKQDLWTDRHVRHPFDVLGCMMQRALVADALWTFPQFNESLASSASDVNLSLSLSLSQTLTISLSPTPVLC